MEFHGIFFVKKRKKFVLPKSQYLYFHGLWKNKQTQDNFSQNYLKSQNLKKTNWLRLFQEFMPANRFWFSNL